MLLIMVQVSRVKRPATGHRCLLRTEWKKMMVNQSLLIVVAQNGSYRFMRQIVMDPHCTVVPCANIFSHISCSPHWDAVSSAAGDPPGFGQTFDPSLRSLRFPSSNFQGLPRTSQDFDSAADAAGERPWGRWVSRWVPGGGAPSKI